MRRKIGFSISQRSGGRLLAFGLFFCSCRSSIYSFHLLHHLLRQENQVTQATLCPICCDRPLTYPIHLPTVCPNDTNNGHAICLVCIKKMIQDAQKKPLESQGPYLYKCPICNRGIEKNQLLALDVFESFKAACIDLNGDYITKFHNFGYLGAMHLFAVFLDFSPVEAVVASMEKIGASPAGAAILALLLEDLDATQYEHHTVWNHIMHTTILRDYPSSWERFIKPKFLSNDINDIRDIGGNTLLHTAAAAGDQPLVELYIHELGMDINAANKDNRTPLHLAASEGHTAIVQQLVSLENVAINAVDNLNNTALHLALYRESEAVDIVKLLLSHHIAVNAVDFMGDTALHLATIKGYTNMVEHLLSSKDIAVGVKNIIGETPLYLATKAEHQPIIALLNKWLGNKSNLA